MAFIDLHCHSSASFDARIRPGDIAHLARGAGLTHIAITDHERLDGALHAREQLGPEGVTIIVGEEIRTTAGDMIGLFLIEPIPGGLRPEETSRAIREQGGIVGLPHGFDPYRPSIGIDLVRPDQLEPLAHLVDYVEVHNARVREPRSNERAAEFARDYGLPAVAVSDAHTDEELGVAAIRTDASVATAAALLSALRSHHDLIVKPGPEARPSLVKQVRRWLGSRPG